MKVQCKICRGKGKIPDPLLFSEPMRICGMYGEQCLDMECEVCYGSGWIDVTEIEVYKKTAEIDTHQYQ